MKYAYTATIIQFRTHGNWSPSVQVILNTETTQISGSDTTV